MNGTRKLTVDECVVAYFVLLFFFCSIVAFDELGSQWSTQPIYAWPWLQFARTLHLMLPFANNTFMTSWDFLMYTRRKKKSIMDVKLVPFIVKKLRVEE